MRKVTWEGKEGRKHEYVSLAHFVLLYVETASVLSIVRNVSI